MIDRDYSLHIKYTKELRSRTIRNRKTLSDISEGIIMTRIHINSDDPQAWIDVPDNMNFKDWCESFNRVFGCDASQWAKTNRALELRQLGFDKEPLHYPNSLFRGFRR